MGILFRYILREVLLSTLIGTLLFTFVLFLQVVGPVMTLLIGPAVSGRDVGYLFLLMVPQTLRFTIPIGVLVGVLVGLGRLSTDGEITAMRAAGLPGRRVALPVGLLAVVGAAACAATTITINPWAQREMHRIQETLKIARATAEVQPRIFIERFPNKVLYVRDVIPSTPRVRWKGVFIADSRSAEDRGSFGGRGDVAVDGPAIMVAEEAVAVPRLEQDRIQLHLSKATLYEQTNDPNVYNFQAFAENDQVLEVQRAAWDVGDRVFDRMSTSELAGEARSGEKRVEASIERQQRFALPVACLIFPMVGIPLAISSQRSGRSVGIVLSVILVFVYWMILLGGVALANERVLPVTAAIWMANVVFAAVGVSLLAQLDAPNRRDIEALLLTRARDLLARLRRNGKPGTGANRGECSDPSQAPESLPAIQPPSQRTEPLFPIIDRYVLRLFLYYLGVMVATFVLIWFVFSFFELLSDMLARQKMAQFIPYLYYLTPFLIYETVPLAVLVATLVCFGILAKRQEVTAFKSCGISLYRLAAPVLVTSLIASGLLFSLDHYYLPQTNRKQDEIRDEIKGRAARTFLRPDRQWTFGMRDRIFYHRYFDAEQGVLVDVNVYDFDPENFQLRRHISAEAARWDAEQRAWVFEKGWVRAIDGVQVTALEEFDFRTFPGFEEEPGYFLKEAREHQQMNWRELRAYIQDLTQSGFDTLRLQVQLQKKLAFPLFAFIMAILAVPFSLRVAHRSTFTPVVAGIGLAITYYSMNHLFEQLARTSQLTPTIAAWSPSIIFGLTGAYLFMRVRS